ncbi:MAG: sulfatase-like hydrolase/transferase, partial [Verrucomicrobiota bacterium]
CGDKIKRWDRTAYFVEKTLDFLKRHKGEPCYVNLWPDDVHTPWVPEGTDLRKRRHPENRSTFSPVLAEYDKQIGRFMDGLKRLGLDNENTMVIFTSDNGPLPTLDRARTGGLRGAKDSLYEGGIREPFILRWPGHIPSGRVDETTVLSAVDFFPTFCQLTGTPSPKGVEFDGEDLSAVFSGKSVTRKKPLFWEYGRNETFGYPREFPDQRSPNIAVREGKWKLLVNDGGTNAELYDLEFDRGETRNVAGENSQLAKRLVKAALEWRRVQP